MSGFLIDENIPSKLQLKGEFVHAQDLGGRMTDSDLWNYAKRENLTIVTKGTDFYDRLVLQGPPPKVIWLRLGNLKRLELLAHLSGCWDRIVALLDGYSLIVVHPDRIEAIEFK